MHPITRVILFFSIIALSFLIRNIVFDLSVYFLIVLPQIIRTKHISTHLKFITFVLIPLLLMLLLVWGYLVGSPPENFTLGIKNGYFYAINVWVRLLLFASVYQSFFGTLSARQLAATLSYLKLPDSTSIFIVSALAILPNSKLIALRLIESRFSRGLVKKRNLWSYLIAIPHILRPYIILELNQVVMRSKVSQLSRKNLNLRQFKEQVFEYSFIDIYMALSLFISIMISINV